MQDWNSQERHQAVLQKEASRVFRQSLRPQAPRRVFGVDLLQNLIRQADSVNTPAPLRRDGGWSVVEVLILRLEKAVIDLVQLVAEDLLRRFLSMRCRVCGKQNPVLVLIKKFACQAWLPAEFADTSSDIDGHVWITIETL